MIKSSIKITMSKIGLIIILIILYINSVFAQTVFNQQLQPQICDQYAIMNKMQQEEQNTRKFIIDTFDSKSQEFFAETDKRIRYLEEEYKSQLRNAVLRLGFLWLFVTIFVYGIFSFLSIKFEQRRYKKMKADLKEEILSQINSEITKATKPVIVDKPIIEMKKKEETAFH